MTTSRLAQARVLIGMLFVGLALRFAASHLAGSALRDAVASLAYGAFTLAVFDGVGFIRNLVAERRRLD